MKVCFVFAFRTLNTTDSANYSVRLANLLLEEGFDVKRASRLRDLAWAAVLIISQPGFRGMIAALLGRLMKKRTVSIYSRIDRMIGPIARLVDLIQLSFSDRIITYTRDYAQSSRLLSRFGKKLHYILPPIGIAPVNDEIYQDLMLKKGGKSWVGVVGGIRQTAGLGPLKLKNTEIIPVGEESGAYYRAIDCLVVPAIKKTDGAFMPQAEAMLFGKPVVVYDIPGIRIPVQITGMGKIAKAGDRDDLAEKIGQVLNDRRLVTEGKKEYAGKIFDLNLFVREWKSLLHDLR